jgi:L-lactate dehydrogenase complex protein LldG
VEAALTVLEKVRRGLGRYSGQPPTPAPAVRLCVPETDIETRVTAFRRNVEELAGKIFRASSPDAARAYVAGVLDGRTAVASNAPLVRACGIHSLAGVQYGFTAAADLRRAAAASSTGITGADYALADTGTLVILSTPSEARLISLLPPLHIALIRKDQILSGLDELFTILPLPAAQSSSMVLITGPSRTADIEQILVRGVHGPGEILIVIVEGDS